MFFFFVFFYKYDILLLFYTSRPLIVYTTPPRPLIVLSASRVIFGLIFFHKFSNFTSSLAAESTASGVAVYSEVNTAEAQRMVADIMVEGRRAALLLG